MSLALTQLEAVVFLPFVLPICLWVIWSDLSRMKIPNLSNIALVAVFLALGLFVLPPEAYAWRLAQLGIVLVIAFLANLIGMMGAGDAKFLAAAAPFIAPGDAGTLIMLLTGITICALLTHRMARRSRLRQWAPDWESWQRTEKFPMGFALGGTLIAYLGFGLAWGL